MIIKGAEPFFFPGGEEGVLLIHGFTGSPAELLLCGEFLNRAGFTVLGVRLAGHGTNEKDLMRMTNEDWLDSVADGYSILKSVCKKIFVVGHSMGALLSLKISLLKDVAKVVTIAAPIFIDENSGLELLPPREKCGEHFELRPRRHLENVPHAANKVYIKMPLISVHELLDLLGDVKNSLPKISVPILIIHAEDDHTTSPKSADFIFENIGSTDKELLKIPDGGHLLPLTENREFVFEKITGFLKRG